MALIDEAKKVAESRRKTTKMDRLLAEHPDLGREIVEAVEAQLSMAAVHQVMRDRYGSDAPHISSFREWVVANVAG